MADLKLKLLSPDANFSWGETVFPDEMLSEEIVAELVEQLGLPSVDKESKRIEYRLRVDNKGVELEKGKSLREQQIVDNDTLRLVSSATIPPVTPKPIIEPPKGDTVEVLLSLPDLHGVAKPATFRLDMTVGEAIKEIIRNNNLPARDPELKRLIDYRLSSKARNQELLSEATFRSARIPHMDRLSLVREAVAG